MKKKIKFTLKGKELFPIWIIFLLFVLAPYFFVYFKNFTGSNPNFKSLWIFPLYFAGSAAWIFYLYKYIIGNIKIGTEFLNFDRDFISFIKQILIGTLFTILSFGIYMPWFIKKILDYFIDNTKYKNSSFNFKGRGIYLFLIIFAMYVSIIIISIILGILSSLMNIGNHLMIVLMPIILIIVSLGIYFYYKWIANITYNDYQIKLEANWLNSGLKILLEIFLLYITLGLYAPLTYLKLYKFFIERLNIENEKKCLKIQYNIELLNDWWFLLWNGILVLLTLGIYYPWALCNIVKRVLEKTTIIEAYNNEDKSNDFFHNADSGNTLDNSQTLE